MKLTLTLETEINTTVDLATIHALLAELGAEETVGVNVSTPPLEVIEADLPALLAEVTRRLTEIGYEDRANVITVAYVDGGEIDRAVATSAAGYPKGKQLRGFTTPIGRVCREMQEEGVVPQDWPAPLTALYGDRPGYQAARGFAIPQVWMDAEGSGE